jgi:RimJ/RimL family protein N-acetyltransferase
VEYIRLPTHLGDLVVRDVAETDLDALVGYWHGGVADLEFLGIDLERLGTVDDTRARFRASIRSGAADQKAVAFVAALAARVIAYTNVNFRGRDGYAHVHFIDPEARNRGIASFLVPFILKMFFVYLPIDRLVFEARTRNTRINRVVTKFGLQPATTAFLERPDGLARAGEFNVYVVEASMVDGLLAQRLGTAPPSPVASPVDCRVR